MCRLGRCWLVLGSERGQTVHFHAQGRISTRKGKSSTNVEVMVTLRLHCVAGDPLLQMLVCTHVALPGLASAGQNPKCRARRQRQRPVQGQKKKAGSRHSMPHTKQATVMTCSTLFTGEGLQGYKEAYFAALCKSATWCNSSACNWVRTPQTL